MNSWRFDYSAERLLVSVSIKKGIALFGLFLFAGGSLVVTRISGHV